MERKQKMKQKKNHNKTCRGVKTSVVLLIILMILTGAIPDKNVRADNDKAITEEIPADNLPDIEIYIDVPDGYYSEKVSVSFRLRTKDGSMPDIKSVKARVGKKGSYTDVTESMTLEITEDCTVHVIATDSEGRTYERSRTVKCFDKDAPTLNASISEGILEIDAKDTLSGIKSIIINGYEYTDIKDGKLTIRLTQFDGGYEKFTIQAVDNAGNKSGKYTLKNPYKKSADSDYYPATELPINVKPTEVGDATATVTEHISTDETGKVISDTIGLEDIIESGLGLGTDEEEEIEEPVLAREFYAITTESGKTFYLIIDRKSGKETVRFLTDITESDLLHVTKDSSQPLPRNSAAKDSSNPINDSAIPNNNTETAIGKNENDGYSEVREMTEDEVKKAESEQEPTPVPEQPKEDSFIKKNMSYIIIAVGGAIFFILGYYFKVVKRKREQEPDEREEGDEKAKTDEDDDYFKSSP